MGLGGFFKKIGKGAAKGAVAGGKVVADLDDIPGVNMAVAMIPFGGPIAAAAMRRVNQAEEMFSNKEKSGLEKIAWASGALGADLEKVDIPAQNV